MTVDEMIEVLGRVKERFGGETTIVIEAYIKDDFKTYELNPDWLKVHEKPYCYNYRPNLDNTRYLSLCVITKGQRDLRFDSNHSKLCVQNV